MSIKGLDSILREHPFVAGLDDDSLAFIAGCARNVVFDAGARIFSEGGDADHFYLLREGSVALEMFVPGRGEITFLTLGAGDILGSSWLVPPYRWTFDARAVVRTRALAFDAACLRGKCEEDARLGYDMMKRFVPVLAQRLQAARLQLADLYGAPGG